MTALSSLATKVATVLCLFVKACCTLLLFCRTFLMLAASLTSLLSTSLIVVAVSSTLVVVRVLASVELASIARGWLIRSSRGSTRIRGLVPPARLTEHVCETKLAHAVTVRDLAFSPAHVRSRLEDVICGTVRSGQVMCSHLCSY